MDKVTSTDIKIALAKKHLSEFFLAECKSGPTQFGSGLRILDGLAIYKSWVHPCLRGYEIKVSRSDFLGDTKFFTYLDLVHELYLVTPKDLVKREELPDSIGLMYYNPTSGAITTRKKAPYRDIEISAEMLMYIIMCRLDSDRIPFYNDKKEHLKAWTENKLDDWKLGCIVSSKLIEKLKEKDRSIDQYESILGNGGKEKYDAIMGVMEKHGISTWVDAAKSLDDALSAGCPKEIDAIRWHISNALNVLERINGGAKNEQQR